LTSVAIRADDGIRADGAVPADDVKRVLENLALIVDIHAVEITEIDHEVGAADEEVAAKVSMANKSGHKMRSPRAPGGAAEAAREAPVLART